VNQRRPTRVVNVIDVRGIEHFETQCPSQTKALLVEVPIKDVEEGSLKAAVHQQGDDSYASVEDREFSGCIRTLASIDITPSKNRVHLGVVRCTSMQPQQVNDWSRTTTFQMFIKIGDENYKMIVDSGSNINAVSSKVIGRCGLKTISYPHPYKVSWINSTALEVKQ